MFDTLTSIAFCTRAFGSGLFYGLVWFGALRGSSLCSRPIYLQHARAADGDVGDVRRGGARLHQAQALLLLGDDVPEQQNPLGGGGGGGNREQETR